MGQAFFAPDNLAELYMLENHVDLLELGIVNHLEQGDNVGVPDFFENGNLLLGLVLGRHGRDSSKAAFFGEARYDFDGDVVGGLYVAGQLDLAMHAAANLFDNLVLVD